MPVPDGVPPGRAVLAANMETALNALWDAQPSPGDHICVVGAGVLGLLTAWLAAQIPATRVVVVDINPARACVCAKLGLAFSRPEDAPQDQDLVVHASASAEGLATALRLAGDEATVLEMSWYGTRPVPVPLGAEFHSRRLVLRSTQVGSIPAARRARWTHRRRLEVALSLLADARFDTLLTPIVGFADLPALLPKILADCPEALAPVVAYPPQR
ncbi:Oxidoreductase, zinc-binding dehydrogenase family [Polymorphum gilvum SL003B-26A1]|uniref:Oxidoreductase, zinc-binding dehydrogenase family n=1 Tax=Polymorphum gilvum (strain LMG 25793 / CGMCC 1.9160 / SL003B-26A1) TaxID=991905 RepID=F2J5H8_POLGS|nr:Oxidoreductase, zinc-binding dehydrogenase family [Polymorphum gilvum SL003B-26A1]